MKRGYRNGTSCSRAESDPNVSEQIRGMEEELRRQEDDYNQLLRTYEERLE